MTPARAYQRTQTETATPERLLVMLMARARSCMRTAHEQLVANKEADEGTLQRAVDIVAELNATLDHRPAPELARNLSDVYVFVLHRLTRAMRGDKVALSEAMRAFFPIAEGFEQAISGRVVASAVPSPVTSAVIK